VEILVSSGGFSGEHVGFHAECEARWEGCCPLFPSSLGNNPDREVSIYSSLSVGLLSSADSNLLRPFRNRAYLMEVKPLFRRAQNKLHWIGKYELPSWLCLLQYWLLSIGSKPMAISQKSALIVAPHQDDETLGCGGLIALKREQGIPVQVIFITDGAASHTWHPQFKAGEIAPIRKQEALTALAILGVEQPQIYFLDKRDGKLKYAPDVERQQTIDQLAQILCAFHPGEVYVTHRQDRSKDHEATYELVEAAIAASKLEVELLQYPIWLIWKTPLFREVKFAQIASSYRLSIKSVQSKKRQAIQAYRSQYSQMEGAGGTVLPPGFLRRFFQPYEVFFKVDH